jgi:hypothetical protein
MLILMSVLPFLELQVIPLNGRFSSGVCLHALETQNVRDANIRNLFALGGHFFLSKCCPAE